MNNFINTNTYKDIIKNKIHCVFVSPHLDDAIFSAGGLMQSLSKKGVPLTLVNVFTKASKPPYTISIKKFLNSCGYKNADSLYKDRIIEDAKVANQVNAKIINLGFVDALWRRRKVTGIIKILSKFIPELSYLYPIYRITIAKGAVYKEDILLQKNLTEKLNKLAKNKRNTIIFGSAGIGIHTDHLITRNALSKITNRSIIYWGDYPYFETDKINSKFKSDNNLVEYRFKAVSKQKLDLVMGYKSQISAIFGKNKINTTDEVFYISNKLIK